MNCIPGYRSIREFEREHGLAEGTGKRHMQRGYCAWPRRTVLDGRAIHPLYTTWRSMIDRTTVKGHTAFRHYGGRGISITPDWYADFWAFVSYIESLGPRPTPQHTLDRIDNDGNYEPGNLRWLDKTEQNFNQRLHCNNTSGRRGLSQTRDATWQAMRKVRGVVYRKIFKARKDAEAYLDQLEAL